MRQFTDSNGLKWDVHVWAGNIQIVRDLHGIDISRLMDTSELEKLRDFAKLVAVVYTLVRTQVELRGLTEEQFGMAMVGDALSNALDALWGAVEDFFPSRLPQRAQMQKVKATSLILEQAATTVVQQMDAPTLAGMVLSGNLTPPTTSPGAMN
ncbi:MAG TPA: hypothetical protein VF595_01130 [Tepidisphaeraceae bacterium]|jgi:hypothetical protein